MTDYNSLKNDTLERMDKTVEALKMISAVCVPAGLTPVCLMEFWLKHTVT